MHSLEAGIVVSIAAVFFLTFLTFTFMRETNISKEINDKVKSEANAYREGIDKKYMPELIKNISNIIIEGGSKYVGED